MHSFFFLDKISCINWKDHYSDPNRWLETNVTALNITQILDKGASKDVMRDLIFEPTLVVMIVDHMID